MEDIEEITSSELNNLIKFMVIMLDDKYDENINKTAKLLISDSKSILFKKLPDKSFNVSINGIGSTIHFKKNDFLTYHLLTTNLCSIFDKIQIFFVNIYCNDKTVVQKADLIQARAALFLDKLNNENTDDTTIEILKQDLNTQLENKTTLLDNILHSKKSKSPLKSKTPLNGVIRGSVRLITPKNSLEKISKSTSRKYIEKQKNKYTMSGLTKGIRKRFGFTKTKKSLGGKTRKNKSK